MASNFNWLKFFRDIYALFYCQEIEKAVFWQRPFHERLTIVYTSGTWKLSFHISGNYC